MKTWFLATFASMFFSNQALACSCVLRSDDPAEFIAQADFIFYGDPIYMTVGKSAPDSNGYTREEARTVFLVTKVYKGDIDSRFRGELPDYFERVERVNDGELVSVYHGFQMQSACDIRFEFHKQLVMAFEVKNRLQTGYCTMRLLEDHPEREQEFLEILDKPRN